MNAYPDEEACRKRDTRFVWLATDATGWAWREVSKVPMILGEKPLAVSFARPDGLMITVFEIEREALHG